MSNIALLPALMSGDPTLSYTPTLNFNKSGFATVKIDSAMQPVQLNCTFIPFKLSYGETYDKWQITIDNLAQHLFAKNLEEWYDNFQATFAQTYRQPNVNFSPLVKGDRIFVNWPRAYSGGKAQPDKVLVTTREGSHGVSPEEAQSIIPENFMVSMHIEPAVWVRNVNGVVSAGMNLTLRRIVK